VGGKSVELAPAIRSSLAKVEDHLDGMKSAEQRTHTVPKKCSGSPACGQEQERVKQHTEPREGLDVGSVEWQVMSKNEARSDG